MAAPPVTPIPALNSEIVIGGTAVNAFGPNPNGGVIQNPSLNTDQGLSAAEDLFVNPVTGAGTVGNGTTFRLSPGQTWSVIPGQTTPTSTNAVTSGHKFSGVSW